MVPSSHAGINQGSKRACGCEKQLLQDYTDGKALLPILTQLASKICLFLICTTAPAVSTSKKVVLSGTNNLSNLGQKQNPSLEEASLAGNQEIWRLIWL